MLKTNNFLISISGLKSKIVAIVFPNFSRKNKKWYLLCTNGGKKLVQISC